MERNRLNIVTQAFGDRNGWDLPVSVKLGAYLIFGRRMDRQLQRLVDHWTPPTRLIPVHATQEV